MELTCVTYFHRKKTSVKNLTIEAFKTCKNLSDLFICVQNLKGENIEVKDVTKR